MKTRRIVSLACAGIFALMMIGAGLMWTPSTGAQSSVTWNGATVGWDPVTTDIQGSPETIRDAELGLWPVGVNHQATTPLSVLSGLPGVPPVGGVPVNQLLSGRAAGTYQLAVRVYDTAGNVSAWSPTLSGVYDTTAPATPAGFRVIVTVNVEVIPR